MPIMFVEEPDRHRTETAAAPLTLIHVTHWKAGSQWIHQILRELFAEKVVPPEVGSASFLSRPIEPGKIYPTIYVTKEQFDSVHLPPDARRFVVIRDLHDTLVSGYFSIKVSHPVIDPILERWRRQLNAVSREEGMIYL